LRASCGDEAHEEGWNFVEPIILIVLVVLVVLVLLGRSGSLSGLVVNGIVGVVLLFVIPFRFVDGIMGACQRYTTHG